MVVIMVLLFTTLSFAVETLYVQSVRASILSEPRLGSREVSSAQRGDALKVLERKDGWFRVEHRKVEGWIPSLLVSSSPPMEKVSVFGEDRSLRETARRRASGYTTAAAARGLLEDRARVNQKYMLDLSSVRWLEGIKIKDEEVVRFLEEGR